jgi:solute:Na+ symporter, SSS family
MKTHFAGIDWVVLGLYFAGTMAVGFYFCRKSRSTEGFTAAGRSLPGWVCGLSIFATYLSSTSFLALPGKAYAENWNPFVFSLALPIATWVAGLLATRFMTTNPSKAVAGEDSGEAVAGRAS